MKKCCCCDSDNIIRQFDHEYEGFFHDHCVDCGCDQADAEIMEINKKMRLDILHRELVMIYYEGEKNGEII